MRNLQNDAIHYDRIRETNFNFKLGRIRLDDAFAKILPLICSFSLDMVLYFTYIHSGLTSADESDAAFMDVKFYDGRAEALVDFMKRKYEDGDLPLKLGLPLADSYLTVFGLRFEDTDQGLYCHINFI
jgi:hypothetical protein